MYHRIFLSFCFLLLLLRDIVHSVRVPLTPEQRAERAERNAERKRVSSNSID